MTDIANICSALGSICVVVLTNGNLETLGHTSSKFCGASLPAHNLDHAGIGRLAIDPPVSVLSVSQPHLSGNGADRWLPWKARDRKTAASRSNGAPAFEDGDKLQRICDEHNIMLIQSRNIDSYMTAAAQSLRVAARARVPLRVASDAEVAVFRAELGGDEHFAVIVGDIHGSEPPLVRLHSQCVTGDVLGSLKWCGRQLRALEMMAEAGSGVLVYLAQGLLNKMRAYALQDSGLDTIDANHALGFEMDGRYFLPACRILVELGVSKVRLITNNPDKIAQLEAGGLTVTEQVPIAPLSDPHNHYYIETNGCGPTDQG